MLTEEEKKHIRAEELLGMNYKSNLRKKRGEIPDSENDQ
jgi:hypothetical protein